VLKFAGHAATDEELKRAVTFADFAQLREQELQKGFREASSRQAGKKFFRRGESGGWHDELSIEQIAQIEYEHAPMMRRLGYALSCVPRLEENMELRHDCTKTR
jgi:aryl sulfotransferase